MLFKEFNWTRLCSGEYSIYSTIQALPGNFTKTWLHESSQEAAYSAWVAHTHIHVHILVDHGPSDLILVFLTFVVNSVMYAQKDACALETSASGDV